MGKKRTIDVSSIPPTDPIRMERNKAMLIDWLQNGLTYQEIADKYGLSKQYVYEISRRHKWMKMRKQLAEREYALALNKLTTMPLKVTNILEEDLRRIARKLEKSQDPLTEHERTHLRGLLDRVLKEKRLEDGKPTGDEATGVARVELVLPEGVKDFGVVPSQGHTVKVIEAEGHTLDEEEEQDLELLAEDMALSPRKETGDENDSDEI